tara:strand:- start:15597 stop:16025 length:429 start_codon:yes stop_codon:yes gene_type:complete
MKFDKIKVVKFLDGSQIVATLENDYDLNDKFINIMYPIEIWSGGVNEFQDHLSEHYMLKAWMGLSDDVAFTINTDSITVVSDLIDTHHEGYQQCVQRLFIDKEGLMKPPTPRRRDPLDAMADALSPDDLLEYLDAKEKNRIN